MTAEHQRLEEARAHGIGWKRWGPYLSERQWGTVREDSSENGDAWNSFSHDQARSRAYRWGEDGLAGFSDHKQRVCFALALWNGCDPILKERLFGLTNSEGNHGEDVKEYYFYLDSTPTHSYMKYLYKYPQTAFPYCNLVETNRRRGRTEQEYELLDTGAFDDDRYFDVFVEFAKETPSEILIAISACNRGPQPACLHLLPTLWFRNQWSWNPTASRPALHEIADVRSNAVIRAVEPKIGEVFLHCEGKPPLLFTENETNTLRLFGIANRTPYVKDGFNEYFVQGRREAVNPAQTGTKAAAHYCRTLSPGECWVVRLKLSNPSGAAADGRPSGDPFGSRFEQVLATRRAEADEFYAAVIPPSFDADTAGVVRQALAGMLWSKQFYLYDVDKWLKERDCDPLNPARRGTPRNEQWHHMYNANVISMPDKWEYPWYAAWDLAFHALALSLVDLDFAKEQLNLMLSERYLHPNGQMPAYEWAFGDVNPPVHAWATIFTYRLEQRRRGAGDVHWLEHSFQKLLLNFTWWVNRKDRNGRNVFEGGFLGLDNIGIFDRSQPLPTGGFLEQADGTAWMTLFCQNMLEIAEELALHDPVYVEMAIKFLEHFLWIASAMLRLGDERGMWDEEDGFFYDVLRLPDGRAQRLKIRSMVGLLPLCAVTVFQEGLSRRSPDAFERFTGFLDARPELVSSIHDLRKYGYGGRHMLSILDETRLRRVLARMLDEREFLSPFGVRSLSRYHLDHPYVFEAGGQEYRVGYLPAESDSGVFGANSNWRGPVWLPVNALIIGALLQYYAYFGNDFRVECPTGSGNWLTLYQVAEELTVRLSRIFLRGSDGRRPVFGGTERFQTDPHWRDCLLFYEYFHGDNGAGIGAGHQTGWSGVIARLMQMFTVMTAEDWLRKGKQIFHETPSA
jgi:hypothetical protein